MRATPVLQKALRRLPLTTKQAGKNYYKGTGTGAMGRHTKWGGYILDVAKMRTYVAPDLSNFNLTPFVDRQIDVEAKREAEAALKYGDLNMFENEEGKDAGAAKEVEDVNNAEAVADDEDVEDAGDVLEERRRSPVDGIVLIRKWKQAMREHYDALAENDDESAAASHRIRFASVDSGKGTASAVADENSDEDAALVGSDSTRQATRLRLLLEEIERRKERKRALQRSMVY